MKKMIVVAVIAALFAGNAVSIDSEDTVLLEQVYYSFISGTITKGIELLNAAEGKLTKDERDEDEYYRESYSNRERSCLLR